MSKTIGSPSNQSKVALTLIFPEMCQNRTHLKMQRQTSCYTRVNSRLNHHVKLFISSVILLCILISNIEMRHLTSHAFKGGHDIDGEKLFICRSHKYGQIIPGKYSKTIKKCSITHNRREAQFNRYEILIQSADQNYEWIQLKKPVINLPENVLFGGTKHGHMTVKRLPMSNVSTAIFDAKGELNSHTVDLFLSSDQLWGSRKRRIRRSTTTADDQNDWSRNWRGHMYEGVDQIRSFTRKPLKAVANKLQNFTEIAVDKRKCSQKIANQILTDSGANCLTEPHKANFYIAKCTLRTGNITSEQIGKIWWKESIQEWVASFPYGGHEIYCLDYSVLTVKS